MAEINPNELIGATIVKVDDCYERIDYMDVQLKDGRKIRIDTAFDSYSSNTGVGDSWMRIEPSWVVHDD